jgi:hypothetical protein
VPKFCGRLDRIVAGQQHLRPRLEIPEPCTI